MSPQKSINTEEQPRDVIVIGASAGGIKAIIEVLSQLPADLSAIIGVVIHRGAASASNWSQTLGKDAKLRVIEPDNGESLTPGTAYVAPADCHMTFKDDKIHLDHGEKQHHTRPAVNPLFESAALAYGPRVVGVILTGGGSDGLDGLLAIEASGGVSLAQTPSEAENASMPQTAILHDHVDAVLTLDDIGDVLAQLSRGHVVNLN